MPSSRPLSIRFSAAQLHVIQAEADRLGVRPSQFVRDAAFARALISQAEHDPAAAAWVRTASDAERLEAAGHLIGAALAVSAAAVSAS